MRDVECPYCGEGNDICHEDGYGYEENELHNQECRSCEKIFTYQTKIFYNYDAYEADCLNGAEHNWKLTKTWPLFFTKMRCSVCDESRKLTAEEKAFHNIPDQFRL